MLPWVLISLVVFALVVVGALIMLAIIMLRSRKEPYPAEEDYHPQGYYMALGISIGAGFGVALGTAFGNIALGIAIGAAMGISIGAALERKNQDNLQPITEEERQAQRRWRMIGLGFLILGIVVFIGFLALTRFKF